MKLVTYNIQYSKGQDGQFDLERVARAVEQADIIFLQEVTRNFAEVPDHDQPEHLGQLLSDHFWVYGPCIDMDASERVEDGPIQNRRRQFGNMVLSRWPILSSRNLLLPRAKTYDFGSGQRGALEAIIQTMAGPLRVYSLHLDDLNHRHRVTQIRYLLTHLFAVQAEGATFTGTNRWGRDQPTDLDEFVVMGDFNLIPESPEYLEIVGESDYFYGRTTVADRLVDSWVLGGNTSIEGVTWRDESHALRLDYGFVSPGIASRVTAAWIDDAATGSDHQPVWMELEG